MRAAPRYQALSRCTLTLLSHHAPAPHSHLTLSLHPLALLSSRLTLSPCRCALDVDSSDSIQKDEMASFFKRGAPTAAAKKPLPPKEHTTANLVGAMERHGMGAALASTPTLQMRKELADSGAALPSAAEQLALSKKFNGWLEGVSCMPQPSLTLPSALPSYGRPALRSLRLTLVVTSQHSPIPAPTNPCSHQSLLPPSVFVCVLYRCSPRRQAQRRAQLVCPLQGGG